jgi:hypothetical protein
MTTGNNTPRARLSFHREDMHGLLLLLFAGISLCRLTRRGKQPVHPISGHHHWVLPSIGWTVTIVLPRLTNQGPAANNARERA